MNQHRPASPTTFSPIGDIEYVHIRYGCGFDIRKIERARLEPRNGDYEPPAAPDIFDPKTADYSRPMSYRHNFTEFAPGRYQHRRDDWGATVGLYLKVI